MAIHSRGRAGLAVPMAGVVSSPLQIPAMLLSAAAMTKSFAGVRALKGVSFDVRPGEVHALVGENGAGKSTLIKIITGAETPDSGEITVHGQVVTAMDPSRSRALGIAAIYQQPSLFPDLTVAENIALALEAGGPWRRLDWSRRASQAAELLQRIGATIDPMRLVETLSMPEQQIVEIAKAIGADAKIVIMDEPTASLTEREVESLFRVIALLKTHGVGIVYISHRLEEVFAIADRITVLRDGETVGTTRARRDRPRRSHHPDGGPGALGRLSETDDPARRGRAGGPAAVAPGDRRRRRVAVGPPGRDPRPRRPRGIGTHAAGGDPLRADARRRRRDPRPRQDRPPRLAASGDRRRHRLCARGSPSARRRARDVGRLEREPGQPRGGVEPRPHRPRARTGRRRALRRSVPHQDAVGGRRRRRHSRAAINRRSRWRGGCRPSPRSSSSTSRRRASMSDRRPRSTV